MLNNIAAFSMLLDVIFDLSVIYIALASLSTVILENSTNTFYGFYFLGIYFICATWCIKKIISIDFSFVKTHLYDRKNLFKILLCLFIFVALYYHARGQHFFNMEVWTDELAQAFSIEIYGVKDISTVAALQQQPPTDYYLSRFVMHMFGQSEFSIRLNAIIFGILSSLIFTISLFRINASPWYILGFLISFLYQGVLVNYAAEARPISLAVFYFIYLVCLYFRYIDGEHVEPKRFFIGCWCAFTSIGLQPLIAFSAILPSVFIMNARPLKDKWKTTLGIPLLALLAFIPIIINIYLQSKKINQFFEINYFTAIITKISNFKLSDFSKYYQLAKYTELIWISPFVLIYAVCFKKIFETKTRALYYKHIIAWVIYHLLFILIYQAIWGIINWPERSRYFILLFVGSLLLSSYIFCIWENHISLKLKTHITTTGCIFACITFWQLFNYYIPNHYRYTTNENKYRLAMKPLFAHTASDTQIKVLLPLPYVQIGYERGVKTTSLPVPLYMKSTNYFMSDVFIVCPDAKRLLCFRPFDKQLPDPQPGELVLFIRTDLSTNLSPNYYENMLNIKDFPAINLNSKFIVSNFTIKKSLNETIEKALLPLLDYSPKDEQNFFILECLLDHYIKNAQYQKAASMLKRLEHLSYRTHLSTDYNDYPYNKEVERLLKYYAERLNSPR